MTAAPRFVFTLTAGRTGTAWLAEFLSRTLACDAVHEPLGIDDFGTRMPDIRLMRSFNERGNNALVRTFWDGKLAEIAPLSRYVETNHTLGKCGLIENLCRHPLAAESAVIVLRRDLVAQAKSYVARGDFRNVTISWQWYLHAGYPNAIVNPAPFARLGQIGLAVWYCYEMDARQYYYRALYGDALRLIDVQLETIVTPDGARALLAELGFAGIEPALPAPSNTGTRGIDPDDAARIEDLMARIDFRPFDLLEAYVGAGRRIADTF